MSATGKTPNYNLAVYREYDITSYLIDFNGNMEAIDTALKKISDAVSGGSGTIGAAEDYSAYYPTLGTTIRSNKTGSTTALVTMRDVVPATYNMSGFVEADTSSFTTDELYGEVFIALDGTPTTFSLKLEKTNIPRIYTYTVPIKVTQKGYVTLEAKLITETDESMVINAVAMTLQKLDV